MKQLISKKLPLAIIGLVTIVMAGTIKDIHKHANIAVDSTTDAVDLIPVDRSVASEEEVKTAQLDLPVSSENMKKINNTWEITRVVGPDQKVLYDKLANAEDANNMITIPLELIDSGIVKVNNDKKQIYRVSLLSDFGTIAIFKKLGNGYKIIEAKRVVINEFTNLDIAENIELVLDRALNPSKSNNVLTNDEVSGQVTLNSKELSNLSIELKNVNGESQIVDIDTADLMEDGAFKAVIGGEEISGVVFNNGKSGYRLTFITGPLAGAILDFATKESIEKSNDSESVLEDEQKDASSQNPNSPQAESVKNASTITEEGPERVQSEAPEKILPEVVQQSAEEVMEERKSVAEETALSTTPEN